MAFKRVVTRGRNRIRTSLLPLLLSSVLSSVSGPYFFFIFSSPLLFPHSFRRSFSLFFFPYVVSLFTSLISLSKSHKFTPFLLVPLGLFRVLSLSLSLAPLCPSFLLLHSILGSFGSLKFSSCYFSEIVLLSSLILTLSRLPFIVLRSHLPSCQLLFYTTLVLSTRGAFLLVQGFFS